MSDWKYIRWSLEIMEYWRVGFRKCSGVQRDYTAGATAEIALQLRSAQGTLIGPIPLRPEADAAMPGLRLCCWTLWLWVHSPGGRFLTRHLRAGLPVSTTVTLFSCPISKYIFLPKILLKQYISQYNATPWATENIPSPFPRRAFPISHQYLLTAPGYDLPWHSHSFLVLPW